MKFGRSSVRKEGDPRFPEKTRTKHELFRFAADMSLSHEHEMQGCMRLDKHTEIPGETGDIL